MSNKKESLFEKELFSSIADVLSSAPDNLLDPSMKEMIKTKWSNPPKAIEILEVLDYCIHGSLAIGFIVSALQLLLEQTMAFENTTLDEVVKHATWREKLMG